MSTNVIELVEAARAEAVARDAAEAAVRRLRGEEIKRLFRPLKEAFLELVEKGYAYRYGPYSESRPLRADYDLTERLDFAGLHVSFWGNGVPTLRLESFDDGRP